ncbi:glycosyltransferase family protein [Leeuwenhoekiella aequorea]|uniref:Glycosyltransferase involved in cell wall biosynthesis n=1 Tax=Leeuwenhoekiella aequorea TaxID=283736 RepID=A0A4V1KQ77_9FLAO|nr:hypothetical protein [Leeuwenhoekiella aequorea]RXG20452.1 hypothetical protein DSM00_3001 [Leeuwenhoekiella aequorea]
MKRIFLVGDIIGSYRSQLILNYFSNRNYEYSVTLLPVNYYFFSGSSFISKFLNFFIYLLYSLLAILAILRCDILFYLPMNTRFLWTLKLANFFGKKTIFDFYNSRYLVSIENIKLGKNSEKKYTKKFDQYSLKYSTAVIFLSESEVSFYQELLDPKLKNKNVNIIPLKGPLRKKAKLKAFKNKSIYNICWWGKASQLHGIENLLLGLKDLQGIRKDFKLNLFENNKSRANYLKKLVSECNFDIEVNVYDNLTFSNGLESYLINNCDISLGSFGDTLMAKTVLLNKVVDTISLGIPMVTQKSNAIVEFGLDRNLLYLSENLNSDSIATTINILMNTEFDIQGYQKMTELKFKKLFSISSFEKSIEKLLLNNFS